MDLEKIRKETIGCEEVIHLNNAGAALMPVPVANAIRGYISFEVRMGGYEAAELKRNEINQFYHLGGKLLNCGSHCIAYTTNATDSYSRALSSIPFKKGDVILTTTNDYASNQISFLSLQKRFDIKIVKVKDTDVGEVDLEDLSEKLKKYRPKLVTVTHVPTNSGLVQPIEAIGQIVSKSDSLYLVDACQSLGQLDVDVSKIECHFLTGTLRKFLRGPRGSGILYVSEQVIQMGLEPLFIDMRGADWISEYTYEARKDAKRFEDWEFAYALVMGSKEALSYLLSLGIENIKSRNKELLNYLTDKLHSVNHLTLLDKGSQKSNIVTFHVKGQNPENIKETLRKHRINISTLNKTSAVIDFGAKEVDWAIRVSPHYYNTKEEIDSLVYNINKIVAL